MKCIINKIWKEKKKGEVKRPHRAWLKSGGEVSGRAACLQRPQIRSTVSISRWGHTDSFKRHPSRLLNSPRNPKHFSKHSKSLKKELLFPNTEEKFQSGDNNVSVYRKKNFEETLFWKVIYLLFEAAQFFESSLLCRCSGFMIWKFLRVFCVLHSMIYFSFHKFP